jgi:hypothetical protein
MEIEYEANDQLRLIEEAMLTNTLQRIEEMTENGREHWIDWHLSVNLQVKGQDQYKENHRYMLINRLYLI